MTLGRKIIGWNVALFLGVLLLGGASLWGLISLRGRVEYALNECRELKKFDLMRDQVGGARAALAAADPAVVDADRDLRACLSELKQFGYGKEASLGTDDEYYQWDKKVRSDVGAGLRPVMEPVQAADRIGGHLDNPRTEVVQLDSVLGKMDTAIEDCQGFITQQQEMAGDQIHKTLWALGALSLVIMGASGTISAWQYKGVVAPLRRLRDGVRKVAGGQFNDKIDPRGDREFSELAVEFNGMAMQLRDFYHRLEEQVQQKSRELVRSQRLASVGFLAAGVAHEINNPLHIMSGYAELSINRLHKGFDPAAATETEQALRIIRDEAFRCKQITGKLLSMTRMTSDNREAMSVRSVARDVAEMLAGLKPYHGRQVELGFDPAQDLMVYGNVSEIKQVLLNLTVNALEAAQPGVGNVRIEGKRAGEWIEISVIDNGRGMTPQTLERVFEPFFTDKRGIGEPGTGLGLSITHAIVLSHGGRIEAHSDGLDRGSRFTVILPAYESKEAS